MVKRRAWLMVTMLVAGAWAAGISVPNDQFERAGKGPGGLAQPWTDPRSMGLPEDWSPFLASKSNGRFSAAAARGVGRNATACVRLENHDATAQGGIRQKLDLPAIAGTYQLTVWARAETETGGRLLLGLTGVASRVFRLSDEWAPYSMSKTVPKALRQAEVSITNASEPGTAIYVDDVALTEQPAMVFDLVADTRAQRPRTLCFGPMNVNYLRDTASQWADRGFRGFMLEEIMRSWEDDVWAKDGNPDTRGEDDALLAEVRAANVACKSVGIDSNVLKVALYKELPDWSDDAAWSQITTNFREGARFARQSGCIGIAIDGEYVKRQYEPDWSGYRGRPVGQLKAQVRARWQQVVGAMLDADPDLVLLVLPEGVRTYGELYNEVLTGMASAMSERNAPGGMHLFLEGTYHLTEPFRVANYAMTTNETVKEILPKAVRDYWSRRCTVAPGAWPLGYYRAIKNAKGDFVGWSGKQNVFGDQVVGSYADKSEWYPPQTFAEQMAALNTFSPRYNWIYSHGAVFWQWTEEQRARYERGVHQTKSNPTLPTVANVDAFLSIIASPPLAVTR